MTRADAHTTTLLPIRKIMKATYVRTKRSPDTARDMPRTSYRIRGRARPPLAAKPWITLQYWATCSGRTPPMTYKSSGVAYRKVADAWHKEQCQQCQQQQAVTCVPCPTVVGTLVI